MPDGGNPTIIAFICIQEHERGIELRLKKKGCTDI